MTWHDECSRLSNVVSMHNCSHKQPPVDMGLVSTWPSLGEKKKKNPFCLLKIYPPLLHHTVNKAKRMGEREKWMSHHCGKPQLALVKSEILFLLDSPLALIPNSKKIIILKRSVLLLLPLLKEPGISKASSTT